jgi:hypothetical protein
MNLVFLAGLDTVRVFFLIRVLDSQCLYSVYTVYLLFGVIADVLFVATFRSQFQYCTNTVYIYLMVTADFFAFSATLRFLVLDNISVCVFVRCKNSAATY